MSEQTILSSRQLIIGLVLALIIGVILTVFVILPAEQGQDPTGFGETTGLNQLSGSNEQTTDTPSIELDEGVLYISVDVKTAEVPLDDFGRSLPALSGTNHRPHAEKYKTETLEILIPADGQVEYKAIMNEGETLLYSWSANGDMYFDFHAHDDEANPDFWTRYSEGESRAESGSIVAPYSGEHGWYWLNLMGEETTVTLEVAGYYDEVISIDLGGEY